MKKALILGLLFLSIGAMFGNYFYTNVKEKLQTTFSSGSTYYFIQEGVYTTKDIMEENVKNITTRVVDLKNDKYYVYLGITKDYEVAQKIKSIYEEEGYQLYIKEMNLSNEEFYNNVIQFDMLIKNTNSKEEILTIEEVVLANYEEIIQKE